MNNIAESIYIVEIDQAISDPNILGGIEVIRLEYKYLGKVSIEIL